MRYAAVVLYFRLGDRIFKTLDALIAQTCPPERIVLVDNASGDRILEGAESRYSQLTVLDLPTNVGYAGGMNAGAALIGDDIDAVLFLTHEVLLEHGCACRLVSVLESDVSVGLVGPALRLASTGSIWSLGGVLSKFGDTRHNTQESLADSIKWLDGACLLIRSRSFDDCGGFDEDYFLYWEDVDISLRISQQSEIRCVADAIAYQDTATAPIYFRLRNQIMFWRKHSVPSAVIAAVLFGIGKAIVRDLRSGSVDCLRARLFAIIHGFSGQLAPESVRMLRE
jgi:GT2 family glycosyltransferase